MSTIAAPEIRENNQSWTPVLLLALAFMLNYADRQFFFAVFAQVRLDLTLSDALLGLTGSVFAWSYAVAMPVAGYMADRMPRHRLVIAALILWSLATLGTSVSRNLSQLIFWRGMMGLTEALFVPSAFALIATIYPITSRSRAISALGLAQFVGLSIGGMYGGWSAQQFGWRRGSQFLVVTGLAYSAILIWRFWGFHSASVPIPAERPSPFKAVRSLPFLLLAAVFFAFCAMLWVIYAWLPTVVHERYQLNLTQSGVTSSLCLQIGSALGVLTGGVLGDWAVTKPFTSRIEVALGGVLGCSPFALLIFSTHSLFLLQIATFCFGLSAGIFIANTFSCLYDFTDRSNLSFATGCLNMLGGAGAGAAIFLAGIFKNTRGIASLMLWTLLFADGASIALFALAQRRRKRHQTPAVERPIRS